MRLQGLHHRSTTNTGDAKVAPALAPEADHLDVRGEAGAAPRAAQQEAASA